MFWQHSRYMELLALRNVPAVPEPVGAGYGILFDETIHSAGYKELRLWVHLFACEYASDPITPNTRLILRFMHCFDQAESFDYQQVTFSSSVTSYINGFACVPVIGDRTRVLCHPENMPHSPYDLFVTCYLLR
ncbi:MAG: hypothetical protein P8X64_03060 [Anaerolineales bacterium]|jgi:hypothetical protein